jgi:hypothetical protein
MYGNVHAPGAAEQYRIHTKEFGFEAAVRRSELFRFVFQFGLDIATLIPSSGNSGYSGR